MPATFPPHTPIVWAVGTTNRAKLESVHSTARRLYPQNSHIVFAFAVPSGVSDQPMSAVESQQGAENRAVGALEAALAVVRKDGHLAHASSQNVKLALPAGEAGQGQGQGGEETVYPTVHFGVGMEGGVEQIGDRYFECGWMAVAENPANDYLHHSSPSSPPRPDAGAGGRYTIGLGSSARFEMSNVLMHKILHEKKELAEVMDELTGETDLRSTLGAMGVLTAGHLGRAAAYEHGMIFAMARFLSDKLFWEA